MTDYFFTKLIALRSQSQDFLDILRPSSHKSSPLISKNLDLEIEMLLKDVVETIYTTTSQMVYDPKQLKKTPLKAGLKRVKLLKRKPILEARDDERLLDSIWTVVAVKECVTIIHSELMSLLLASDGLEILQFSRDYKPIARRFYKIGKSLEKEIFKLRFTETEDLLVSSDIIFPVE